MCEEIKKKVKKNESTTQREKNVKMTGRNIQI